MLSGSHEALELDREARQALRQQFGSLTAFLTNPLPVRGLSFALLYGAPASVLEKHINTLWRSN